MFPKLDVMAEERAALKGQVTGDWSQATENKAWVGGSCFPGADSNGNEGYRPPLAPLAYEGKL
jgi:hypothetical protein